MDNLFCVEGKDDQSLWLDYFDQWQENHSDCLMIKLGAEVAYLAGSMRFTMKEGTDRIIRRLVLAVEVAIADGSLPPQDSEPLAANFYLLWLGAGFLLSWINRAYYPAFIEERGSTDSQAGGKGGSGTG